jgi:hypothetical protein
MFPLIVILQHCTLEVTSDGGHEIGVRKYPIISTTFFLWGYHQKELLALLQMYPK